jgi:hypothetical protein
MDPLYEYVDFAHRDTEKTLDLETDGALKVVCHLGDASPVLHDHVEVDDETAVLLADLDAAMQVLAPQKLGDAIPEAAGGHAHDAVVGDCRVAGNVRDDSRENLDTAPVTGAAENALLILLLWF